MAIITISRGSYTRGKEIAEEVAQNLGYRCISREVLLQASKDFDIPEIKLMQAIKDAPSFLDRVSHGREKYIAYIQAALLNQLKEDNVLYHGFASNFFVADIPMVLRIRILAEMGDRIKLLMDRENMSRKDALRMINKVDEQRIKWGKKLYGINPGDPAQHDLVLHIDRITKEDAVDTICRLAEKEQFQTTPDFKKVLADLAIAAEVRAFLVGVKPRAEVCIDNGYVTLKTEVPVSEESDLVKSLGDIVQKVPGVKGINVETQKHPDDKYVCLTEPGSGSRQDVASTYFTETG
ncbi:AAA family ATPase [Thermodesulfobacteriota bacterium]